MIVLITTIFNIYNVETSYLSLCDCAIVKTIVKTCVVPATLKKVIHLLFIINFAAKPIV